MIQKILCYCIVLTSISSCVLNGSLVLNSENIEQLTDVKNRILNNDKIIEVERDENFEIDYYAETNEYVISFEYYKLFFINNKHIFRIRKDEFSLHYNDLEKLKQKNVFSEGSFRQFRGEGLILNRFNVVEKKITLIRFFECADVLFLGYTMFSRGLVYCRDLDLSVLTEDELYFFGFGIIEKTSYENWYYFGMVG